jgi:hypothetical protein
MDQLRLAALDAEDLAVISAQVQDAVLKVGDIRYFAKDGHLVVAMNRFAWDRLSAKPRREEMERRRAALSFAGASDLKAKNIRQDAKDAILSLLAVTFTPDGDEPSGRVELVFAGGASLSFAVECIEAQLSDLGAAWSTEHRPEHSLD